MPEIKTSGATHHSRFRCVPRASGSHWWNSAEAGLFVDWESPRMVLLHEGVSGGNASWRPLGSERATAPYASCNRCGVGVGVPRWRIFRTTFRTEDHSEDPERSGSPSMRKHEE